MARRRTRRRAPLDPAPESFSVLTNEQRDEVVSELASRPGHEKVRALTHRLLVDDLGADSRDIDFEKSVPEARGRIDALLGRTVFEFKSDLRRERGDAEEGLTRYLAERESETGERYVGVAADGADFAAYFFKNGSVVEVGAHRADPEAARELSAWLRGAVALGEELTPDPATITREFGRGSLASLRALDDLAELWARVGQTPEALLKRELWDGLLGLAYGARVGDDALFLQHTYLAVIAKAIAWAAIVEAPPEDAGSLLRGAAFSDFGISGQNEPDFFDWLLADEAGDALVMRIYRHANRFRLRDIRVDILKALYESLIDPETRHELGEYYTPDWLAARMIAEAVENPLEQRVMDPACGSGTFLFHAVRAALEAAEASGMSAAEAARLAVEKAAGIDIHPVAVIFARATYLLALMPVLRQEHPGEIPLPVYLGDALQWNVAHGHEAGPQMGLISDGDTLEIFVPAVTIAEPALRRLDEASLRFPAAVASDASLFDRVLNAMLDLGSRAEPVANFAAWMERRVSTSPENAKILRKTYKVMLRLQNEGRNHIWGYVARNLARPVYLASEARKADVVIGNPPWVAYRYMSAEFQRRFRAECEAARLWSGGKVATHQDLSGYFFMRAALLYMRRTGRIALVMPHAAMSRQAYAAFRDGEVSRLNSLVFRLRFTRAWGFGPELAPLFPVPSCVLFAEAHHGDAAARPPDRISSFAGTLPRRDADRDEADANLVETAAPWPTQAARQNGSPYRRAFRQGAILVPRRLVLVEEVRISRILPPNPVFPMVRGRAGNLDKPPWKNLKPPEGPVDREFLRPALLGESIAPFRVLAPQRAVIPWDEEKRELMDARTAISRGCLRLTRWLEQAEALWERHKRSSMSFLEQCDYYGKLTRQFPIDPIRVVYTTSGTNLAACIVQDETAIIDSSLYWARVDGVNEGRYLCGILNSEVLRGGVERYQAQGQWGARHFDKYVFNLPFPKFDEDDSLHREIADAAKRAEEVARAVPMKEGEYFTRARGRIRDALAGDGAAARLESLVAALLEAADASS